MKIKVGFFCLSKFKETLDFIQSPLGSLVKTLWLRGGGLREKSGFVLQPSFWLCSAWHVSNLLGASVSTHLSQSDHGGTKPHAHRLVAPTYPKAPRWGRLGRAPRRMTPWSHCAPDSQAQGLRVPGCLPGNLFYVP